LRSGAGRNPFSGGVFLSLGQIAPELGETRDVTRSLLAKAGISPAKRRGKTPLYRLADVLRWLRAPDAAETKVTPHEEDKFYAAQLKKLEYERQVGQVIPADDVDEGQVALLKRLIAWVESMPDQLERSAGLTPKQVEQLERRVDEMRGDLHGELGRDRQEQSA
jgi:hypothetical protein